MYYDREGKQLDMWGWILLREMGRDYVVVGRTDVGEYTVSTVWLGLDHSFSPYGPPIIFETMIWDKDGNWLDYQERYATEEEALAGHAKAIQWMETLLGYGKVDV